MKQHSQYAVDTEKQSIEKLNIKGANRGKEPSEKAESQSMSPALYHQVVINDAAFSAVGSCQASRLSACSASSAIGHDMWDSGWLNSTGFATAEPPSPSTHCTVMHAHFSTLWYFLTETSRAALPPVLYWRRSIIVDRL